MWYNMSKEEEAILRKELEEFLRDNPNVKYKDTEPKDHQCEEGMTVIGGWVICKHCGDNLREIK